MPKNTDSKLDETESLVTSVEISDDEVPVRNKANIVKVGVLETQSSIDNKPNKPLLKR